MTIDVLVNDFAIRSFRDVADHDYITARMAYRARLFEQFHWSGLQAIEKYLKCVLLLNRIRATDVGHSLARALKRAEKLPFQLHLTPTARNLIDHLDTYGRFRYLEASYYVAGPKLVELDRTVWEIRRYCQVLNYGIALSSGMTRNMLHLELQLIAKSEDQPPHLFRLNGGELEKILTNPKHPARQALVWNNFCFAGRRRKKLRMRTGLFAKNSPLSLHPEILDEVLKFVYLPADVIKAYRGGLPPPSRC
jgi:HEPN domain-containing protein